MRLGLTSRLILTVLLLLIPAAAWIGVTIAVERQHVDQEVERRLNDQLSVIQTGIQGNLEVGEQNLQILSTSQEIHADPETCNRFLEKLEDSDSFLPAFARADRNGTIDCASPAIESPMDLGESRALRRTLETGRFEVGEIRIGRFVDQPAFTMAYPMHAEDGAITGAVITATTIERLLALEQVEAMPEGSVIGVLDMEGTIVAVSEDPDRNLGVELGEEVVQLALSRPRETYRSEGPDGVERLFLLDVVQVRDRPAAVVVSGIPVQAIYGPVTREALTDGAFLLVLLVLVASAGAYGVQRVVLRPVREMTRTADALQEGDLEARIPTQVTQRSDEIGNLAHTLNLTVDRLNARMKDLDHANERLADIDRIKTDIINTIAHELQTPLLVVNLQNTLLKRRLEDVEDESVRNALQVADRNIKRLDRLVQSLVKVAKIQAGTVEVDAAQTSLGPILERLETRWKGHAEAVGVHLEVTPSGADAWADQQALEEVLGELLDNAFKFTQEGGEVRVWAEDHEETVDIVVEDTGTGIDLHHLGLLEPQGDPVRGGRIGIGSGVYIARALTRRMGGRLSYESKGPDRGTRAIVRLGVAEDDRPSGASVGDQPPLRGPTHRNSATG